jgi:hypothetical protein
MKLLPLVFILATSAFGQGVQFSDLIKNPPPDQKGTMTLLVTVFPNAVYACPKGFTMFLKNVKPAKAPLGIPDSNYMVWFAAQEGQIITSGQGHEFRAICLKGF